MDSDKSSGVPISHQMSSLYLQSDDAHAVGTVFSSNLSNMVTLIQACLKPEASGNDHFKLSLRSLH